MSGLQLPQCVLCGHFVPWTPGRKNSPGWITNANGCDIWQGAKGGSGYPHVRVAGRDYIVTRLRYEREIGPIPGELPLDHFVCDNGAGGCCNPFHCRPVSVRENNLRGTSFSSACAAKTHCPAGHPLSGENLIKSQLARGHRDCRTCANAQALARYYANKSARQDCQLRHEKKPCTGRVEKLGTVGLCYRHRQLVRAIAAASKKRAA